MTTPTNWPNPERPGYPMFPEQDGWHLVAFKKMHPRAAYWNHKKQEWSHAYKNTISASNMGSKGRLYYGPFFSGVQITEMLAGKYSIPVIQTALRVWDALDECERTDADDMILLEQNGLMIRGIVEDANDFEDLEEGETVWHFSSAGDALVSAIRNLGDAP